MSSQKLAVVTGGAGFVGSHLCERLAKDGYRVISLDNYFTGSKDNHVPGVEYREGHTKDIAKLVPEDPDIIYHLGEYSRVRHSLSEPSFTFDLNILGSLGVLEYWRDKRCKLVYAGSSTKFAHHRIEEGILGKDLAPYTWGKASMTDLVAQYARWYELPYSITYFNNVYGPRERSDQYGTLIEIFHQNWLQGLPCRINGSGGQRRPFTHVLDTVDGIMLAGEKGANEEYGICAKESFSLLDVARMFGAQIEYGAATKSTRSSEPIDTKKLEALGWRQKYTLPGYVEDIKQREIPKQVYVTDWKNLKPKKRILIFSLVYYPNFHGGAEPQIKEITDRIAPENIEFHMVTCLWNSNIPRVERYGNVLIHRIGFGAPDPEFAQYAKGKLKLNKYLFQILGALKALQLHARYRYDGIWASMAIASGIPAVLFKFALPKIPYILTLQEGTPFEHNMRVMRQAWPLFKQAFLKATVIQSISNSLIEWARHMGYKGEIALIKNGANPNDLKENYTQADIAEVQEELGKKDGDIFLVNTSRLAHQKGHDITIQALQYLPENIKYVIVGDGDDEPKLRDLTNRLNLRKRVIFTGRVDRQVVTRYRKACDIFVAPSRSEGLGNAFVSALASRLPLITTGVGGIADYAFDNETAWLVPVDDPKAIAEKVKEIIAHPEKAKQISENARKMVERDYDWDKIAVKMQKEVFEKVI